MQKIHKILHFIGNGKIGGQERAQYQLLKAFQNDEEFECGVAVGQNQGLYIKKIGELSIPIIHLNIRNGFSLNFSRRILHEFRKYDIHHLHDPSPNCILYSLLAGSEIKRVFTRRGGIRHYSRFNIKKKLKFQIQRFLITKYFDGFSGNTINATESVKTQYGVKDREIAVLYNGIDFSLLEPTVDRRKIRQLLGFDNSDFLIGTACQLVWWKRVDLLIRAFSKVKIENKKLVIFGRGKELPKLQNLTYSLNIQDRLLFAGEVENMANYMQTLNCFVLPSGNRESFGNSLVESMYLRIPSIIMSDSSGLQEHIKDGKTGFIADNVEDLARKIEYVYHHPLEVNRITANASRYVFEKYSFKNMVKDNKKLYLNMITSGQT